MRQVGKCCGRDRLQPAWKMTGGVLDDQIEMPAFIHVVEKRKCHRKDQNAEPGQRAKDQNYDPLRAK